MIYFRAILTHNLGHRCSTNSRVGSGDLFALPAVTFDAVQKQIGISITRERWVAAGVDGKFGDVVRCPWVCCWRNRFAVGGVRGPAASASL